MKCKNCDACHPVIRDVWNPDGYWDLKTIYQCWGVQEPFEIADIDAECSEYPEKRDTEKDDTSFFVKNEVKTYMVHAMCECGGEFETGDVIWTLDMYPPKFGHVCNKCGKTVMFSEKYPKIEYEEVK